MVDPALHLRRRLDAALAAVLGPAHGPVDPVLHRSIHADYQADAALSLARTLKKNPREVGAAIAAQLTPDDALAGAEVSGPGYVNLTLRDDYVCGLLATMAADPRLGLDRAEKPETFVVDYSSPNLAKETHVGHLRSTIIGDALVRVFAFLGHRVIRQNHIGDWGTPFGMLIEQMIDEQAGAGEAGLRELSTFYRAARVKFDADPAFAERARNRVVLLQSGDEATLRYWRQLIALTVRHLEQLYQLLGVTLGPADIAGESTYNAALPGVASDLVQLGLATMSQDSLCVFPAGFVGREGEAQPLIVRKQDGGYGYVATDLAAIRHRLHTLGADHVLYVVGTPQSQHFAMVFTTAREAGWVPAGRTLEHIAFGSVLGEDKKPIKSRAGESISLLALLEESVERARAVVDQKSPHLPEEQRAAIARAVGIGAVKYADLSNDRVKDYVFAWDRLLSFDGNTAPYLMYAHARTRSILAKAGWTAESTAPISLTDPAERALALELVQFPSVVQRTGESRQIHRLCQYLYDLATTFTTFFERCPVLKSEEPVRSSRLALCVLTARVLAQGLDLLGIEAPRVM